MSFHAHNAYDYAERIREWLPRRLQELREHIGRIKGGFMGIV